jgi:DivIVA domain-containing protein
MIDLTPLEVRKKKGDFRRTMRGYEPQAVDDFLDLVADRLEQIVREHFALNERVASIDTQIADYRERERALTEALVSAQEMREDMRQQMEREADLKRREAEADADAIRVMAEQTAQREEENIRKLRARQSQFVQSYRAFLERELAELAVIAETLDGSKMMGEEAATAKKRSRTSAKAEIEAAALAAALAPEPTFEEPPIAAAAPAVMAPPIVAAAPAIMAPPIVAAAPVVTAPPIVAAAPPVMSPPPVAMPTAPTPVPPPEPVIEPEPVPEPEPAPQPVAVEPEESHFPEPFDTDFDALLDEVPFAPIEHEPPLPLPHGDIQMDLHPEPVAPPAPPEPIEPPEPDLAEIDLIDEAEDDNNGDNDGWVSTLLEGKGD